MNSRTSLESPLEGLLKCGNCGEPMAFTKGHIGGEPKYFCRTTSVGIQGPCLMPDLNAPLVDSLFIGTILRAILTGQNAATVMDSANEPRPGDGPQRRALTEDDLRELKDDPRLFVRVVGGATGTKNFLSSFISWLEIYPAMAAINYSIPLPYDGHLAGRGRQEFALPPEALVRDH